MRFPEHTFGIGRLLCSQTVQPTARFSGAGHPKIAFAAASLASRVHGQADLAMA
jgi:hypothetical protein